MGAPDLARGPRDVRHVLQDVQHDRRVDRRILERDRLDVCSDGGAVVGQLLARERKRREEVEAQHLRRWQHRHQRLCVLRMRAEVRNERRRRHQSFHIDLLSTIYFDENSLFPKDTKSISYSMLRKIKSHISEALPYYVFEDETTSAHLRLMINKIDSIIDAQVMVR